MTQRNVTSTLACDWGWVRGRGSG